MFRTKNTYQYKDTYQYINQPHWQKKKKGFNWNKILTYKDEIN